MAALVGVDGMRMFLNTITAELVNEFNNRISIVGATTAEALIKRQVFNDAEDSDGNSLSPYTKGTKSFRKSLKRQTANKDLEITGELRKSIKQFKKDDLAGVKINAVDYKATVVKGRVTKKVKDGNRTIYKDSTKNTLQIAKIHEKREGVDIFNLQEKNAQKVIDTMNREIIFFLKKFQ